MFYIYFAYVYLLCRVSGLWKSSVYVYFVYQQMWGWLVIGLGFPVVSLVPIPNDAEDAAAINPPSPPPPRVWNHGDCSFKAGLNHALFDIPYINVNLCTHFYYFISCNFNHKIFTPVTLTITHIRSRLREFCSMHLYYCCHSLLFYFIFSQKNGHF